MNLPTSTQPRNYNEEIIQAGIRAVLAECFTAYPIFGIFLLKEIVTLIVGSVIGIFISKVLLNGKMMLIDSDNHLDYLEYLEAKKELNVASENPTDEQKESARERYRQHFQRVIAYRHLDGVRDSSDK